ncbi:hypothetical protein [Winogradskyella aurantiaca]|uniref:hypothetical protein n=1 Tax=Winogradskyella aurantiaca TaxID=2219558 RepID=UPI000E1CB430|nr:hypothetical protein [Winogradskyella aurantiaca]
METKTNYITEIIEELKGLPDYNDLDNDDKQVGYLEGVCDCINVIVKHSDRILERCGKIYQKIENI